MYKLINTKTDEEYLCDKVIIDGFDYYVNDEYKTNTVYIPKDGIIMEQVCDSTTEEYKQSVRIFGNKNHRFVLATNNPNMDIPQVVDEVDSLACEWVFNINGKKWSNNDDTAGDNFGSFKAGYNKSKETHPFSEEDLKSLLDFITNKTTQYSIMYGNQEERFSTIDKDFTIEQLIQIWKEQQPKIVYYEN